MRDLEPGRRPALQFMGKVAPKCLANSFLACVSGSQMPE
jgi:hypothetical protein